MGFLWATVLLTFVRLADFKIVAASFVIFCAFGSCIGDDPTVISDIHENFIGIKSISVNGAFLDVSYVGDSTVEALTIEALLSANARSRAKINIQVRGENLIIDLKSAGRGISKADGYIKLTGPQDMNVNLNVSSGGLYAEAITNSRARFGSGSGNIQIKNIVSSGISINSTSGEVWGEDLKGDIFSKFTTGNVDFHRINGSIFTIGTSGTLKVRDLKGRLDASSDRGDMELERVSQLGKLKVLSGNINCLESGLGEHTDLFASFGNIFIKTHSKLHHFNYDISVHEGSVKIGDTTLPRNLRIYNGMTHTVKGVLAFGKIYIEN